MLTAVNVELVGKGSKINEPPCVTKRSDAVSFLSISACTISVALRDKHLPVAFAAGMLFNNVVIALMQIQ
jgi:hypothetical protein